MLEKYSEVASERTRNFRFLLTICGAGLTSGIVDVAFGQLPGGMPVFVLLGGLFGAVVACSLAINGMLGEIWKAACLVALTMAARYISFIVAAEAEMHVWGNWSMASSPTVSPYSLFVGGFAGGCMVLTGTLLLIRPGIGLRAVARRALYWSLLGGVLGVVGWALGPSLGTLLVPQDYSSQYAQKATPFENTPEHSYALSVVWQTGMAFALGMNLRGHRPNITPKG